MGGRWEPAKTVERFFFHLKRKLSFKQYYLLWQWFSSWKTSWAHFHVKDHCITPEPGTGTKEGSNSTASTRHQDVLLLQPKPFGFSTTIFSIWFLAGIRKKKLSSSEALLEKLHIPFPLCQLAKHPETWHWACGYLFPLDIEVDIWCVSWQKLKLPSLEEKQQQPGRFSSHGRGQCFSIAEVFWCWQGRVLSRKGEIHVSSSALRAAALFHSCLGFSWEFSVAKVTESPVRHSTALNLVPHWVWVVTRRAWIPAAILLIFWGGEMEMHDKPLF